MPPQLAWIGLGNMGRGMCTKIVEKGQLSEPLIIFNRTTERAHTLHSSLPSGKSTVASSIADAVSRSDMIFMCLGDDGAVNQTVQTICKSGSIKGKLFVDCSTVHPNTTNNLASTFSENGADFVACPVFGAPAMADAGQLICVLAGPGHSVKKVLPYCKGVMGRANIDYSDQPHGQATLMKIIGNTLILDMVEALAEGHTVAERSGLGNENLHQFVETMFSGPYTAYSKRLMEGDYYKREELLFGVDLARKDAKHALDLARASGTKMSAVEVADGHLAGVQKHMGKKGDIAGIYGAVRLESGLEFEK
ncbi:MAG: hypothetical protein Q9222_004803 [Ikaeria aurantiellina]